MKIFFKGKNSSIDEKASSAIHAVRLDNELGGKAAQIRLTQDHETKHFLQIFKGTFLSSLLCENVTRTLAYRKADFFPWWPRQRLQEPERTRHLRGGRDAGVPCQGNCRRKRQSVPTGDRCQLAGVRRCILGHKWGQNVFVGRKSKCTLTKTLWKKGG